ncbi:branched-chain amino acid transport system II carrier protein [Virgibacillus dokdonensis]|uniref:Branched-chain amino acid transport system carrier protein n=1 Tax=Virgibacillus dokdonensis TaxID=302167 RepID=A0A3E0WS38_9BACI|nr:branched-chain amino acid transport system II carrier protein [Virgibacillus dokdonensis]RFA35790.1 branched-chain amino acid transport system II carrier protein [Virgibacillus dokdonensis]
MDKKLSFSSYAAIGVMLFALFFGAGNLIFPAQLGQMAGGNIWQAVAGFLITGVGLPLLGILAMSFSGSNSLQDLAGRIHPAYGVLFTTVLYLTIGPFFAAPRTATVAFDVGFSSFMTEEFSQIGLFIFSFLFFVITMLFSLYPAKIVDYVGKLLAPGIVILLLVLLTFVFVNPMGAPEMPQEGYVSGAFVKGFLEGYNTMDALASLVFGIIVIKAIRSFGVTSKIEIMRTTAKAGTVAIALLALVYVGIAYLGATSTSVYGIFETGGPVLSSAATHYFGTAGMILLAIVITLACLTTSIGLTTACSEYFHSLYPKLSYRKFVLLFTIVTFTIANFGLANIIKYSIPVLMLLYPLAIVLMILAFLSPLFHHKRPVYVSVTLVTFGISLVDGLKTLCDTLGIAYFPWLKPIISFYESMLPLYNQGLGWLLPAFIVLIISGTVLRLVKPSTVHAS